MYRSKQCALHCLQLDQLINNCRFQVLGSDECATYPCHAARSGCMSGGGRGRTIQLMCRLSRDTDKLAAISKKWVSSFLLLFETKGRDCLCGCPFAQNIPYFMGVLLLFFQV